MTNHTNEASHSSFVHGPFRFLRNLGAGGCGVAVAAQDIPTNRVMCIKMFVKDNLKFMSPALSPLNELAVYKRLALARPCPGTRFLMGLEFSFQTTQYICFAMVCPFPLRAIRVNLTPLDTYRIL